MAPLHRFVSSCGKDQICSKNRLPQFNSFLLSVASPCICNLLAYRSCPFHISIQKTESSLPTFSQLELPRLSLSLPPHLPFPHPYAHQHCNGIRQLFPRFSFVPFIITDRRPVVLTSRLRRLVRRFPKSCRSCRLAHEAACCRRWRWPGWSLRC